MPELPNLPILDSTNLLQFENKPHLDAGDRPALLDLSSAVAVYLVPLFDRHTALNAAGKPDIDDQLSEAW